MGGMSNQPAANRTGHFLRIDDTTWKDVQGVLAAQGFSRASAVEAWFKHLNGETADLPRSITELDRAPAAPEPPLSTSNSELGAVRPKRMQARTISRLIRERTGIRPLPDSRRGEDGVWVSGTGRAGDGVRVSVVGVEDDTDLPATVRVITDALADTYILRPVQAIKDDTDHATLIVQWRASE